VNSHYLGRYDRDPKTAGDRLFRQAKKAQDMKREEEQQAAREAREASNPT